MQVRVFRTYALRIYITIISDVILNTEFHKLIKLKAQLRNKYAYLYPGHFPIPSFHFYTGKIILIYMTIRSIVHVIGHARHCYLVYGVAACSRNVSRGCRTSTDSDTYSGGNKGSFSSSSVADERKKRPRTAFTPAQIKSLETEFEKNKYLSVAKRLQLSKSLKLTETQVRRMSARIQRAVRNNTSNFSFHAGYELDTWKSHVTSQHHC